MANVGMITPDITSPYNAGDTPIEDRLNTTLGHTMFFLESDASPPKTAAEVASWVSTNSLALVVITSAVTPSHVDGDIFSGLAIPVLSLEGWTWDNDQFTGASGGGETSSTYTQLTILASSHPCAGGLSGDNTILTSARKLNYAKNSKIASDATCIAEPKDDTSKCCMWAIETGDTLADSTAAPARRAGLPFIYDALTVPDGGGNAWALFDSTVAWLIGTTLTPSVTFTLGTPLTASGQAVDSTAAAPDLILEMAFGIDFDTEPTTGQWTDLSSDVRHDLGVRIHRGRSSDLGVVEPGWSQFRLANRNRDYEPEYPGGAHYPNIRPRTHIRWLADFNGVRHQLFRGLVESWLPQYPASGLDAVVDVSCVDAMAVAAQTKIDGGYISPYILDAPTGSLHWPFDEQTGNYAREILTPTANSIWIAGVTLGDDTFATDGISRRQYPLKTTAAQGYEPAGDLGHSGELTVMAWFRNVGTAADPCGLIDVRKGDFTRYTILINIEADGGLTAYWQNDGFAVTTTIVASSDLMNGNWHFVAIVRTGSGTSWTVEAFLDGASLAAPVTGPVETPWPGPSETESINWNFLGNTAQVSYILEALSDVAIAEIYNSYLDMFPAQTTDERIALALDYMETPSTWESLGVGASTMAAETLKGSTVGTVIDAAARSELGLVFVDGAGQITFHPRTLRTASLPAIEVGEGTSLPVSDVTFLSPDDLLANVVVVTWATGSSVSAVDTTSVAEIGERRLDVTINVTTETLAQDYADHLLAVRKDPAMRVDRVTLAPHRDPANMFFACLDAELSDRVNVNHDPVDDGGASTDIDYFGFIEAIDIHIIDTLEWLFTWRISPQALSISSF